MIKLSATCRTDTSLSSFPSIPAPISTPHLCSVFCGESDISGDAPTTVSSSCVLCAGASSGAGVTLGESDPAAAAGG